MSEELKLRIISGVTLAIVVLLAAWVGGIYFALLAQLIGLLIYFEWCTITGVATRDLRGYAVGWVLMVAISATNLFADIEYSLLVFAGSVLLASLLALFQKRGFWLPGGIAYAGASALCLGALRGDDLAGFVAVIFLFALVWGTDVAAYFVGRAIGGPKLAPQISPGKTWSGAVGGTVVGVLLSVASLYAFVQAPGWLTVVAAAFLSVLSQIGDLFESYIKRRFKVKDSSRLIPGHGGVMDRVDGLVFACFGAFFLAVVAFYLGGDNGSSLGALLLGAL